MQFLDRLFDEIELVIVNGRAVRWGVLAAGVR
jgi:hypothetical protein